MTTLREAAQQALTEMANARDYIWLLDEGGTGVSEEEILNKIANSITALRAALAESERDWSLLESTQESLREHMAEIQRLRAALAEPVQEPLTIERLRDALVASRIIPPAAVEDPDEYDDGVTLFRIEALHRRIT